MKTFVWGQDQKEAIEKGLITMDVDMEAADGED